MTIVHLAISIYFSVLQEKDRRIQLEKERKERELAEMEDKVRQIAMQKEKEIEDKVPLDFYMDP